MASIMDQLVSDDEMAKGVSVGTFRWKRGKKMVEMPPVPKNRGLGPLLRGWQQYLTSRCSSDVEARKLVKSCQEDPSVIDGLSYPLTLLFALQQMSITPKSLQTLIEQYNNSDVAAGRKILHSTIDIVLCGAAAKAEERLLIDSGYWAELGNHFKDSQLNLYIVGPEALPLGKMSSVTTVGLQSEIRQKLGQTSKKRVSSASEGAMPIRIAKNMTCKIFVGTSDEFFDSHPSLSKYYSLDLESRTFRMTVAMGFNPGFGAGIPQLMRSWTKSLIQLATLGIPAIFSQANDYSDLNGELRLLKGVVGVRFVLTPTKNPFAMATVAQGRVNGKNGWSCGNSYIYAFQNFRKDHQQCGLPLKLEGALIGKVLSKISKELRLADARGGVHGQPSRLKIAMESHECGIIDIPDLSSFEPKQKTKMTVENDKQAEIAHDLGGNDASNKVKNSNVKTARSNQKNDVKMGQKAKKVIKGGFLNKKGGNVARAKNSTSISSAAKGSAVVKMQRISITEVDDDEDSEDSDENGEETMEPVANDSRGFTKTSYDHFGGAEGMADFDELD